MVANGSGYLVALGSRSAVAATDMRCIAHRGISSAQAVTAEESIAGLTALMAAFPWVNGVEIDARLSTDGTPWLLHDETFLRVFPSAPNAASEGIEDCTDAELTSIGACRLDDYLEACLEYHFDTVMVQHYTGATEADLTAIVAVCEASGMADRILIMTSTSTSPNTAMASLRALGWEGRIGMYGATAGTWSTYSAAAATNNLHVAFAPPTAYDSNRTLHTTLASDGVECGASTESDIFVLQHAESDGCLYALTDDPGNYAYSFTAPTNEPLPVVETGTRRNFADSAFTIAPDFSI
jgi:glycerophosphoryl diester phosphodiesterase